MDTNRIYFHFFKEEGYVFQKNLKSATPSDYTLFYFLQKLPVMNMLVFNVHKMTDMHKGYAYQFSNFITYKKPRIDVCVVYYAFKESNDQLQSAKHLIVLLLL
jgi:hypothetical protein